MTLVLVRVDCRLIHGQILEAWIPFTQADCLIVANDEVAGDLMQRTIMEMAVPPTIETVILNVRDAARSLATDSRWAGKRIILLVANCQDALVFLRTGPHFDWLNLGNINCSPGKTHVTCSVSLDGIDMDCLKEINKAGVAIEARGVPQDPSREFKDILDCCPRG